MKIICEISFSHPKNLVKNGPCSFHKCLTKYIFFINTQHEIIVSLFIEHHVGNAGENDTLLV